MAYTIVKSDGTVLTTIADGTINTDSTSLGLPGRNFAGWGQPFDTNFVRLTENFASTTPPANPLRGQLWYNTNLSTLYVCPTDGVTNINQWLAIAATSSGGTTTFGNVTVTSNLTANNITALNNSNANSITASFLTVTTNATIAEANVTTANLTTVRTSSITTGATSTPGTLTGTWTVNGTAGGNSLIVSGGNLFTSGNIIIPGASNIRDPSGNPITFAGSYNDGNVSAFLPTYTGNVGALTATLRGNLLTTGGSGNVGNITGNWTLTTGSRLQATYADLAERFESDEVLTPGTVVEIGGTKEVTKVKDELSENIFGVVSNTAAYLMNSTAGTDETHPPIALAGRVTVTVTGTIAKGQRLVSAGNGIARAAQPGEATAFNTIGRALADKNTNDLGTVEAVVMIR
jgi:hypothetical protein